jgi:hypothetical protein
MAGSEWKEMELSSGVTVLYGPFPGNLYWDIMGRALDEHPDPEVPQKEIEVLLGTEEVDDPDDPEYQKKLNEARLARFDMLGKAALELCVEIVGWPDEWAGAVASTAKYATEKPPEDDGDRRVWFLHMYALRTREDWSVIGKVQRFSQIADEEVRQRAETFPGDVAGPEGDGADAPGPVEE